MKDVVYTKLVSVVSKIQITLRLVIQYGIKTTQELEDTCG